MPSVDSAEHAIDTGAKEIKALIKYIPSWHFIIHEHVRVAAEHMSSSHLAGGIIARSQGGISAELCRISRLIASSYSCTKLLEAEMALIWHLVASKFKLLLLQMNSR